MEPSAHPLRPHQLDEIVTRAQQPHVVTEARIATPTLVIMLGSTPAKAGLELSRQMLSLSRHDRRRVSLVYIDTDDVPSDVVSFRRQHEGMFQEFSLRIGVPAGISFATLPQYAAMHTFIPNKTPQYFANGAGGIRNNGHVAAAFDLPKIEQTIESALVAIEKLDATPGEQRISEVQVNIVAFLGGGTGSGILGDIAVIVRQMLLTRQYQQRINLFCMLPEPIEGASMNDVSWRKSNATACLLELLALSHATSGPRPSSPDYGNPTGKTNGHTRIYEKYMLGESYYLTDDPIANEVYLVGRTSTGTADDSARIVGLDLFQRITDASGVGFLEHSTWVNRRSLGAKDERGLYTMFGTSCPLEIIFPAQETARAFAQISAAYLLPALKGQRPARPVVSDADRSEWKQKWRAVARLKADATSDPRAVQAPEEFSASEFDGASEQTFAVLWRDLEHRQEQTDRQTDARIEQQLHDEEVRLLSMPDVSDEELTVLGQQIRHLQMLEEEYRTILAELEKSGVEEVPSRPKELEDEYLRPFRIPLPGFIEDRILPQRAAAICDEYNAILDLHCRNYRYDKLKAALTFLLSQTHERLRDAESFFDTSDAEERARELSVAGRASAAWHGRPDYQHPHLHHIFELPVFQEHEAGTADRNVAVERLYFHTTFPPTDAADVAQQQLIHANLIGAVQSKFVGRCMAYLNTHALTSDLDERGHATGGPNAHQTLQAQGKHRLVDRVVEFFTAYYMDQFRERNLFDLLDIGAGPNRTVQTSECLYQHLSNIRRLMRELVAFEETLWQDGSGRLDTTVFLGMNWKSDSQYAALRSALKELGPVTRRNQTAQVATMIDPHRLEVSYGQHGLSIATIPEFFRDRNSAMSDYLQHQAEWYGTEDLALAGPPSGRYGNNQMPVHTSGEMERLVCAMNALGYEAAWPHAQPYGTSLRGRVIRIPGSHADRPNWDVAPVSANGNGGNGANANSANGHGGVPHGYPSSTNTGGSGGPWGGNPYGN